ncbi:MAG: EAL domain-containing protein [Bradyrhizobiaceae bacterium]|nr:MAG: EAL domain-containing protein [Bradyrhizobiaceae bacterium]
MSLHCDRESKKRPHSGAVAGWLSRFTPRTSTIRVQILFFCLLMSAITAAVGIYATSGVQHAGDLVAKTFDESLMSINYARAAAADFSEMRVASSHRLAAVDPALRAKLDNEIQRLEKTLSDDLAVAAERSQSPQAAAAAAKVQQAADAWSTLHKEAVKKADKAGTGEMVVDTALSGGIDEYSKVVDQQIELLVNYTAGDGFLFRQRALSAINRDIRFNIIGLAAALLLSALVSWLLARRIIGPVAMASHAARSIADGNLDTNIPKGGADELGTLLTAMGTMRNNIKEMVQREIAQRQSAQARLTDALENSREGVVLLDADGRVALANSRASEFIESEPGLLQSTLLRPDSPQARTENGKAMVLADDLPSEARLRDGRWLRVSQSETQEGGVVVVFSDISAQKRQEVELHETNVRLDAALENMSQGLCLYDSEARLQVFNRRFCEIFNVPSERLRQGMTYDSVLALSVASGNHGDQTVEDLLANHQRLRSRGEAGSYFKHLSDGRIICAEHRPTSDGGWLTTYDDVTEQRRAESQITFMARHDALTKLPNRLLLAERIEQAIAQAGRGPGFAVLCLDLDNFKQVNDTLGHPVGDDLLRAVADRLRACVREIDTVARLGGDEFAIIQSETEDPNDAGRLARRIVECIGAPYEFNGQRIVVGCSVGISLAPNDGTSGEKLLKNADVALYRAKTDGRGIWRFFEPEMDAALQRRRALELDLREAMEKEQFEVYYQPIYDLRLDRISGFEALLRWNHPVRGMVSPDQFIPVAEEIGLIIPLGEWVLKRACERAALWPGDLKIAINVSSVQFRSPRLVEAVTTALRLSQLAPGRVELEITESVLLTNSAETLATLHQLRTLGIRIALDDFGTGYSSLSYLRSFPFDKLKIDQSFVGDLTADEGSKLIVRAIVSLGKSLGMRTTAEGVRTIQQLNDVAAEGCSEAQGYLFSKPVPDTEIGSLILKWRDGFRRTASGARSLAR